MSSSASSPGRAASRCLLCSVGCPVRVIRAGPDQYLPDYVPHAGYAGLCGRGSVLVELADHPERIREAHRHAGPAARGLAARRASPGDPAEAGDGCVALGLEAAAREMAAALGNADSAALIVDGNLDADTVASAGRFAAGARAKWAVLVPPSDEALVRALDSSGCRFVGPEALASSDAMFIVGDPFATHPVAAHWILAAKKARPRMPVLVLGDGSSVTADFASAAYQATPGAGLASAVAAVRTSDSGRCAGAGADAKAVALRLTQGDPEQGRRVAGWKEQLQSAKQAVIVLAPESGRASVIRLASEAAALAKETGAAVCPLTTYGNAWGSVRAASAGGATAIEAILREPVETLVVIGADLESVLAPPAVEEALGGVLTLIYVGPMPNATSRRAGLVLPSAFAFEDSGRALLGPGREVAFGPLLPPPAGVPTVREILAMAGAGGAAKADIGSPVAAAQMPSNGSKVRGEGLLLRLAGDPIHFADGSLTRACRWPQAVLPRPVLVLAEADARAAGLAEGRTAVVRGPGGSAEAVVATDARQRAGQARVSAAFPAMRSVFGWDPGAPDAYEPVRVQVGKA